MALPQPLDAPVTSTDLPARLALCAEMAGYVS